MVTSGAVARRTGSGGMALMVGAVVSVVASLFQPGVLISNVDQTDFAASILVMADHAGLTHLVTMLVIFAMLLYSYGFFTLFGLPRTPGPGDSVLRFGLAASMFGWSLYIVAMGMRHFTIHLMQRAADSEPGMSAGFESLALSSYAAMAGIVLALVAVFPIATALTGFGLSQRISSMNIFKLAAHGLTAMGIVAFLIYLLVQHSSFDPTTLLTINSLLLWFGTVCLFIVGLGMYQGRSELSSAD